MLFSVVFIQSMERIISIFVCHSNQVEDDLDFEGINFPVSTNNTDNLEQHDNGSANVLEVDDETSDVGMRRRLLKHADFDLVGLKCKPLKF